MHRTQISLEEHQYNALLTESRKHGVSLSAVVRGLVDKHLATRNYSTNPIGKLAGIAEGSGESVGQNHNQFLYGKATKR
ncbi:MAG: hypothetical protein ACR2RB_21305 [Gammaproteobacteria bacterium]